MQLSMEEEVFDLTQRSRVENFGIPGGTNGKLDLAAILESWEDLGRSDERSYVLEST